MRPNVYFAGRGEESEADLKEGKVTCSLALDNEEFEIRFKEPMPQEGVPRIALLRLELIKMRDTLSDVISNSDGIRGLQSGMG